jgi:hypothetical protein
MEAQVRLTGYYWGSLDSSGGKDAGAFVFGLVDSSGRLIRCYAYGYTATQLAKHAQQGQRMVVTGQVTPFGIVVEKALRLLWDDLRPQRAGTGHPDSGNASRQP